MSERIATPIVKNKFWVVEEQGEKIATIQARDDGGFVYVHDDQREHFSNVSVLKKTYNIKFGSLIKVKNLESNLIYGFPVTGKAFNQVWDVQRRLPIFTKTKKSKSFFCAGHYLIKLNNQWSPVFCPKNITLHRYEFKGPFKTKEDLHIFLNNIT